MTKTTAEMWCDEITTIKTLKRLNQPIPTILEPHGMITRYMVGAQMEGGTLIRFVDNSRIRCVGPNQWIIDDDQS